jgi:hypothetical protein
MNLELNIEEIFNTITHLMKRRFEHEADTVLVSESVAISKSRHIHEKKCF